MHKAMGKLASRETRSGKPVGCPESGTRVILVSARARQPRWRTHGAPYIDLQRMSSRIAEYSIALIFQPVSVCTSCHVSVPWFIDLPSTRNW